MAIAVSYRLSSNTKPGRQRVGAGVANGRSGGHRVSERVITTPRRGGLERGRTGTTPLAAGRAALPALASSGRRVKGPEVIVGLLLTAGCALAAVLWADSRDSTRPALVLSHAVERGHVLTEDDFAAAPARATGMRLLAFDDRERMLGRIAVADLDAATPLSDSVAVALAPIGAGEALVGLPLESGRFPAGLRSGSSVDVVATGDAAGASIAVGTVESVDVPDTGTKVVVTLRVRRDVSAGIAGRDDLALVEVAA